jgi:uncharacterized Tic20 family protein
MTSIETLTPTQDERVMAALSHISALIAMMGVIAPIVIWATQKEKSKYVGFQSLQALAFQLTMIAIWIIGMGCYMCSFFGMFASITFASSGPSQSENPLLLIPVFIPFLTMGIMFIGIFVFIVYGVIGAIMTFQGKPFHYFIIGNRVERFMEQKTVTKQ